METAPTANDILNREFLEIRAKILELAASFDRIDRATGDVSEDARIRQIAESLKVLASNEFEDRAAAVQMIYSLPYSDSWRGEFGI
jgi:hypothetical protein